jgi:hypothetical protein
MPNPAFTNKAGSTITYYYPKIVEYTEDGGLRRRGGRQGTDNMGTEGNDNEELKRGGTTGEYT